MASTIDRTSSNPQLQFTWRGCAKWLEQCKVLRTDAYPPDAQVVHFAHSLRDGVLLCHLITRLDPEALDFRDVCLRPQMAQVRRDVFIDIIEVFFSKYMFDCPTVYVPQEHQDILTSVPQTF